MIKDKLLTIEDLIEWTSLSRSTIYSQINAGYFPPPINIGMRKVRWKESEVAAWLEERIADRDNKHPYYGKAKRR